MKNTRIPFVSNQRGMVSIIVTMVLIIVMTLVVLAMSQNSNREQRQALDRQLSDQAFYNAESGISDWSEYLYKEVNNPSIPAEKTSCETPAAIFDDAPNPQIDGPEGVNSYSCVLYDKAPKSLEYDTVTTADSIVTPIEPYQMPGSSTMRTLQLKWKAKDGASGTNCNFSATSALPENLPGGCDIGGLRIDLVNPSGFNRDAIIQNNFPAFLLPGQVSGDRYGVLAYSAGPATNQGPIGVADCDNGECRLSITGLNIANDQRYYLHFKSLYSVVNLTITGCNSAVAATVCNDNNLVKFNSSQIEIDSTGKSNDVLRRVRVRLPVQSQFENAGSFSLKTTQSICKLIRVETNTAEMDTRCQ